MIGLKGQRKPAQGKRAKASVARGSRRQTAARPDGARGKARSSSHLTRGRRKTQDWWPAFRASLRPGLERDTQLMPWLIAESVCGEVACFLNVEIPDRFAVWLDAKAERCYARNAHFHKLMRGRGNAPREWLRAYMRHWFSALLDLERPDLYECLPDSFALGHPLPPPVYPRRRWRGNGKPLHPPRDWDPQRVLQHRRWHWLSGVPVPDGEPTQLACPAADRHP